MLRIATPPQRGRRAKVKGIYHFYPQKWRKCNEELKMKNEELRKICFANYFIEKGKGQGRTAPKPSFSKRVARTK